MSDARSRSACSSSALIMRMTGASEVLPSRSSAFGMSCSRRARSLSRDRSSLICATGADGLVVRLRELGGETLGVDGARLQRPLQHALEFGDALDRRVGARQHQHRVALVAQRQHAVRARECVGHAARRRGRRRSGVGRGDRGAGSHGGHAISAAPDPPAVTSAAAGAAPCGISDCLGVTGWSDDGVSGRNHGSGTGDGGGVSGVVGVSGELN